jgi:hypothetical protein
MTTAQRFAADCLAKFQLARELGATAEMVQDLGSVLEIGIKSNGLYVQFSSDEDGNGIACTIFEGSRPHCFGERTAPDACLAYLGLCGKNPTPVA